MKYEYRQQTNTVLYEIFQVVFHTEKRNNTDTVNGMMDYIRIIHILQ